MGQKQKTKQVIMTEGVIWKQLLAFSMPLLVGNLFQQLYNTVDSIVVGNFIGSEALAAVGSSNSLINLIIGMFMGIATGAGVIISQYYGAKDDQKLHWAVHTCNEVYKWLVNTKTQIGVYNAPAQRVLVYREYKRGRIPGCEPMHSAACNIGRWIVRFKKG